MEEIVSNKRIAKNTLLLYLRMLFSIIVSLYTSRVVLQVLGIEDYGVYGIVGSIVALFTFLNGSMARTTSRFLTFELGRGDKNRLHDTFSSAFIVHVLIALMVLTLAETVGLWFLFNKLVIPAGRMWAAYIVYQLSVLATMISITQVPYSAILISHENFNVYAYIEILNVTLKLIIVLLLQLISFDKLVVYAFLVVAVNVIISLSYRWYCIRHFDESRAQWIWKPEIFKPMISFSGWELYCNGCVTAFDQGRVFLINAYFGVALNAASSIASTVSGTVRGMGYNIIAAYDPVIIKLYAQKRIQEMERIIQIASKVCSFIYAIVATPLIIEMDYVLELWLKIVPPHAAPICRIILFFVGIELLYFLLSIVVRATGRVKRRSIAFGTISLASIFVVYALFKCLNAPVEVAFLVQGVDSVLFLLVYLIIIKKQVPTMRMYVQVMGYIRIFISIAVACVPSILLSNFINDGLGRLFLLTGVNAVLLSVSTLFIMLTSSERKYVLKKMRVRMQKRDLRENKI